MVRKWFKTKDNLSGWNAEQATSTRHKHLREEMRERAKGGRGNTPKHQTALRIWQALHGLSNVTQDPKTRRKANADKEWIKTTRAWKRR